ncbi:S1 family peptidase [Streptomyces hesseae]|uniref:S1 family peptidase n=1 Tax=Streptomyces hesseae TaxID=3075519 RepID=UPI00288A9ADD|nr:S1 family peptidase [Streptomyces sp. DSM 40473]
MPAIRPRSAWATGLTVTVVAASLLAAAPASAVVGDAAKDGSYAFTAKLDIGGQRSCTAALVEQQWLVTAASCFADNPAQSPKVPAGAPKLKTIATIGRTDLTRGGGSVMEVVELVPRADRDLVMARLAKPVTGITPAAVTTSTPLPGEDVRVAGYGRTKDEWVPDRLHSAAFTIGPVKATRIGLAGKSTDAAVCQGDDGGPAFRDVGGRYELVGVNSMSWQGGCFGTDEAETRRDAVDTRVDDIADWIQSVSSRTLLSRAEWKNAAYMASGYFTGNSVASKRHMDLFVVWKNGSASLYQGSDNNDPKTPFSAEHQIAKAGSIWQYARAVTGGSFTGSGSDGLIVRWKDGEVTEYTHLDQNGVHEEKNLHPGGGKDNYWTYARLITAGRFTANSLRDDLLVLWEDGSTSMYTDVDSKKLSGFIQLTKAGWENAAQISAGDFTGKKTSDLLIQWKDGETTIFPGVDPKGYHGRINIRQVGSPWKNMQTVTVGSFTSDNSKVNDILIGWDNGNLGLYPSVDADGTHGGIELIS